MDMIEVLIFTIVLCMGILIGIFVTLYYLKGIIKDQIDKETDKHFDWLVQFLAPKEYISGKQFSEIATAFAKEFMCDEETKNGKIQN